MKQFYLFLTTCLFASYVFFSCTVSSEKKQTNRDNSSSSKNDYAEGFSVNYFDDYKQIIVHSPWNLGEIYATYYLVNDGNIPVPEDGIKIQIPIKKLASASVTHIEFLNLLGELETLTGVCQPELIYNFQIRENLRSGILVDLGDAFKINVEKTLSLKPQALMVSGLKDIDANIQRIMQSGIPVIFNNEWMETSLLGRAEWIKFVAAFYNKEELADSLFHSIQSRYNHIREKAAQAQYHPSVMSGSNFRGTWYMPGGSSYMGKLFKDSGSTYYYSGDDNSGSIPLTIESVLHTFAHTDVWLNCNYNNFEELIDADPKHALFDAVKKGKVYNFNKRTLPSGANDFWESAVARPDLLLSDIIAILHPELLPEHELFYSNKLY